MLWAPVLVLTLYGGSFANVADASTPYTDRPIPSVSVAKLPRQTGKDRTESWGGVFRIHPYFGPSTGGTRVRTLRMLPAPFCRTAACAILPEGTAVVSASLAVLVIHA
jgi:hypothetical protein